MQLTDLLTLAVLTYIGWRLTDAAVHSLRSRRHVVEIVQGLRPRHFLGAVPTLVAVIAVAVALFEIPGLSWGWWTALGGEGNPVFGAAPEGSVGPLETIIPYVFGTLLVLGLPLLVEAEEWIFRRGAEGRTPAGNRRRAVLFGLVHAVVGIPIGAALALSVGGGYLTWCYLRGWRATGTEEGALLESTRAHLAYNLVIVALVVVALAVS
jgi:hypothetical protein